MLFKNSNSIWIQLETDYAEVFYLIKTCRKDYFRD